MKSSCCIVLALAVALLALANESTCLPEPKASADVYYPPDRVVDANPEFTIEDHSDLGEEEGEEVPWDK